MSAKCPVVHFDHHSKEFANNRSDILKELRDNAPVAFTQSYGGHWIVSSYELCSYVLEHAEIFSSEKLPDGSRGVTIPSVGPRLIPAEADAPLHTKLRRAIAPAYSPKAVKELDSLVRGIVEAAVSNVIEKGEFDIVDDFSEIIPPLVGLKHLGYPEEQREAMVEAIKIALSTNVPGEKAMRAFQEACGRMLAFGQSRRKEPTGDLMSVLAQCTDPVLADEDLMWMGITLFVGGFKNPGALISNMLLHLGREPALRARLAADRALIPKAVNEFLRFYTPGVSVARTVVKEVELGGVPLKEGDRVLVMLPGANHDEAAFRDAGAFDLDRQDKTRTLAFGGGPHFCVGFKLANVMFEALLNEIFDRMPNYVVHADKAVRVDDAGIQAGYTTIPASVGTPARVRFA